MKEWKVLLDKTVEDNSIMYYTADAVGCKEFYVSIFFTNDEELTSEINGSISINASGSPWSTGTKISGNIKNIAYNNAGNNNRAIVFGFEAVDGIIIPIRMFVSDNNVGSSNVLVSSKFVPFSLMKSSDSNSLSYRIVDEIESISVGSYAKYFGRGSKILILGR